MGREGLGGEVKDEVVERLGIGLDVATGSQNRGVPHHSLRGYEVVSGGLVDPAHKCLPEGVS